MAFLLCRRFWLSTYYRRQKNLIPKSLKIRVNCPKIYRKKSSLANIIFTLSLFIINKKLTQIICILSIIGLSLQCQKNRNCSVRLNFIAMFKHYLFKNRSFRLFFDIDLEREVTSYSLEFKNITFKSSFNFITTFTHLLVLYIDVFQRYLYGGFKNLKGSAVVDIFWQSSFPLSLRARLRDNFPNSHFYNVV